MRISNDIIAETWARLRPANIRLHCITNSVVQNFTANVLLAVGVIPSMTTDPDEIGGFMRHADALLVNIGTMDAERRRAISIAIGVAHETEKPWLLDPVFIDRDVTRCHAAQTFAYSKPRIIRANVGEITALTESDIPEAWSDYAEKMDITLAVSGKEDRVVGTNRATLTNGHGFGAMVTGGGCALSALMAAVLAIESDAPLAAATAFAAYGVAQERAARDASGPGSFAVALLDELHKIDAAVLRYETKLQ